MSEPHTRRLLWGENARLALSVARAHRLRSVLVVSGVAIGIAALMTMVAVLGGLGHAIHRQLSNADRVVVYVSKVDILGGGLEEGQLDRPDITPDDARALSAGCPAVEVADYYIEPAGIRTLTASFGTRRTRPLLVLGTGPYFHHFFPQEIDQGRAFAREDVSRRRRVCMLGHAPAQDLFPHVDPIGKSVRIGGQAYDVVGTYTERRSLAGSLGENYVALPYETYRKDLWDEQDLAYVLLTVEPGATTADVETQARAVMRRRRVLRPGEEDNFAIISASSIEELARRVSRPLASALVVVSSIGLVVGGIGVMNVMLVSVVERTGEIGLRKAVGARDRDVLAQVLVESAVLTGAGGVLGVLLGVASTWALTAVAGFPMRLDPILVIGAVIFSLGIGIACGLYPASRAARLAPAAALRAE